MDWNIEVFDELPSTQTLLKARAEQGAAPGLCIQARAQSAGYGRQGREWIGAGGNLFLSVLLRPSCEALIVPQMALVAGVALGRAVGAYLPGALLKWPNDVLIEGRKLAGILLETELDGQGGVLWLALGVGVNIASSPAEYAACMEEFLGAPLKPEAVRDAFLSELAEGITLWEEKGLSPIAQDWLRMAHPLGSHLKIKLGETLLEGYFGGLDGFGNLVLKLENGDTRILSAGEVHFG